MDQSKICLTCKTSQPLSDFPKKRMSGHCVKCIKEYRRVNQEKVRAAKEKYKTEYRKAMDAFKAKNPDYHRLKQARKREKISDDYVRHLLSLPRDQKVPQKIIKLKREQIKIFRATKQLLSIIKESQNGTK
jgi:hypothetical protein